MRTLTIAQGEEGSKGRVFQAAILALVQADCWEGCTADTVRPAYMMLGISEGAAGAVLANLRMGREALVNDFGRKTHKQKDKLELLRKAGYEFAQQRVPARVGGKVTNNVILQVYLPHIFRIDPGFVDPAWVRFCMVPRAIDVPAKTTDCAVVDELGEAGLIGVDRTSYNASELPTTKDALELVPYAGLFGAYLNARTACPLVPNLTFLTQVLIAFIRERLVHRQAGDGWGRVRYERQSAYSEVGITDVGLAPGLMMCARAEDVTRVLSAETQAYFARKGR